MPGPAEPRGPRLALPREAHPAPVRPPPAAPSLREIRAGDRESGTKAAGFISEHLVASRCGALAGGSEPSQARAAV